MAIDRDDGKLAGNRKPKPNQGRKGSSLDWLKGLLTKLFCYFHLKTSDLLRTPSACHNEHHGTRLRFKSGLR